MLNNWEAEPPLSYSQVQPGNKLTQAEPVMQQVQDLTYIAGPLRVLALKKLLKIFHFSLHKKTKANLLS